MSIEPEILNGRDAAMGAEHGIPSSERNEQDIVVRAEPQLPALPQEMSIEQVAARVRKVRELQQKLMRDDVHFGVIPGTERQDRNGNDISKKTLLKPGAELLCLTFMLDPQYENEIKQIGEHREITCTCRLYHIPTGRRVSSGVGSCSTYESKYAYRKATPTCPNCQKELRRSKNKDEWYCWQKMGGCGATFPLKDSRIKPAGRTPNPDLPDSYNTVLKMASKRALIDAVLKATAASECYTQDVGDDEDEDSAGTGDADNEQGQSRPADSKKVETKPERQAQPKSTAQSSVADTRGTQTESTQRATGAQTAADGSGAVDGAERNATAASAGADAAGNRPPANQPPAGQALSQGHINLLKKILQNAKLIDGDDAIINTMSWLSERFSLELEYDDQKSAEENLVTTLRRISISKISDVRAAIQEKGKENVSE